jgi:hypothetical protein
MEDINFNYDMLSIWQNILGRLNAHRITPNELALKTTYSIQKIERGIKGEHISITLEFLNDCVFAFGLADGRKRNGASNQTWEQCIELLKPPAEMPPKKANFWEDNNYYSE